MSSQPDPRGRTETVAALIDAFERPRASTPPNLVTVLGVATEAETEIVSEAPGRTLGSWRVAGGRIRGGQAH